MTKLGNAIQGKAKPVEASRFALAIAGARVRHPFVIPRLEIPAVMTLVPHSAAQLAEAAVWSTMRGLELELNRTTEQNYEAERARRILSEAVFDPDPLEQKNEWIRFGTVEEWGALDDDVIAECWRIYGDVRETFDPVSMPLSKDELAMIADAVKKKDPKLLRFFGVRRLATYLLTTAEPPSISATPMSGPSESSEAT
jgi:hypothetical protein